MRTKKETEALINKIMQEEGNRLGFIERLALHFADEYTPEVKEFEIQAPRIRRCAIATYATAHQECTHTINKIIPKTLQLYPIENGGRIYEVCLDCLLDKLKELKIINERRAYGMESGFDVIVHKP